MHAMHIYMWCHACGMWYVVPYMAICMHDTSMTKILSKQAIVKEYKKHGDFLVDKKHIFTRTHAAKISCPEKPYILASPDTTCKCEN